MKAGLATLLVLWMTLAGATQNISVQGVVKNQHSGQALMGAQVTLTVSEPAPDPLFRLAVSPELTPEALEIVNEALAAANVRTPIVGTPVPRPASWTATTDSSGRFQFSNVSAGPYTLSARLPGFVGRPLESGISPPAATSPLNVVSGEKAPDVELLLIEGSTVEGRVTAPDGSPLSGATVVPFLLTYRIGRATIAVGGPSRTTDTNGVYRLNALGPGEYFIAARPSTGGQAWGRTFYPSTPDPLTVAPLRISDKSAFRGIDIRVQNMQTFAVRGRAFNPLLQGPPRRFPNGDLDTSVQAFSIVPRNPDLTEPAITIQNAATAEQARRNGDFEIRGIRPGLYDVFPVITSTIDGEIRYASGRIPVEIRERDVDGLVISISAGIDVRGHITVNGDASLLQNRTLRVSLRALDNIPQPIVDRLGSPRVESNGSFAIKHVPEALYSLVAGPLPPNIYVADIRQRGVSVFDNGFPVGSDAVAPLEVLLNTDAQALEGNVIDTKQNAVPQAWIVLVPNSRRQNPSLYRTGTSDKEGRFKIPNVPPGEYIAFASKSFPGPFWLNPDFLARYEARGERVSVKAGSTAALRLKAIER